MGELHQTTLVPSPQFFSVKRSPEGNPWPIGSQRWDKAEIATKQIISEFWPTTVAERRRVEVIMFLQELLRRNLRCDVLAYGSVPLKTYLPHGDIDLTVPSVKNDDLVNEIASLLEREVKNSSRKIVVKDVRVINAEVKLVKCIVQNFVVDISINQIGGLCALCFLENVDRFIGRNHLFKESIILIKAWCFYESRTLGAHAGLISTYALEILVLYIFHVFYETINGPLSVLYKFLEYFCTFDWDNYCISLLGPVKISALPEIIPETPPNSCGLLLGGNFLRYCLQMFSVPTIRKNGNGFQIKHLNIIDPLKGDNNVGRSINQANSIRIRSAFGYGAAKLRRIILAQEDDITDELHHFFSNALTLCNGGLRLGIHDPEPLRTLTGAEKTFDMTEIGQPRIYNNENTSSDDEFSGNDISDLGHNVLNLRPLDLTGDLHDHVARMEYARSSCTLATAEPPLPPPWIHHGSMKGGVALHPGFHLTNQNFVPRPPFRSNPRTTMTSFPNMPMGRGRNVKGPRGSRLQVNRGGRANMSNGPRNLGPNASRFGPLAKPMAEPMPPSPSREPWLHRNKPQNSNRPLPVERVYWPTPVPFMNRLKVHLLPYHLTNEDDFPPLSA